MKDSINEINRLIAGKQPTDILAMLADRFAGRIAFSTSFGVEDQILTHYIFMNNLPIRVFTLDTGRLFKETYYTWSRTLDIYKKPITVYSPQAEKIERMVGEKGPSSFYHSVENRKECCYIRKIEPLKRALSDVDCWITGIRAEQSDNRTNMTQVEWDGGNDLIKVHPIYDWSFDDVWDFIKLNNIPYNPLHDEGFPSIGCQPCTRAVQQDEDFRAGRWWWENKNNKECGLHVS